MEQDAILDLVGDAVIVFASTGEIRLWNASAARMYGVPADGAIGHNLHH
jgi:PAS domain S-box-containing protein